MALHSTNYFNTFIEVAEDTKANAGTIPPSKGDNKTIAQMQYELISRNPYKYSSDEVLFQIFAERNDLTKSGLKARREEFFSKGQACLRASPLTKTYGFGVHHDSNGKVAIYGVETKEYEKFVGDENLKKVKGMRSTKKI